MRPGDSLKSYISFLRGQLAKVSNCDEVSALAFINGLQVTHPLYKHLLKHNVAKMSEVLSHAQSYIQLEEAMKAFSNHSMKPAMLEVSRSLLVKLPITLQIGPRDNLLTRRRCSLSSHQVHSEATDRWSASLR